MSSPEQEEQEQAVQEHEVSEECISFGSDDASEGDEQEQVVSAAAAAEVTQQMGGDLAAFCCVSVLSAPAHQLTQPSLFVVTFTQDEEHADDAQNVGVPQRDSEDLAGLLNDEDDDSYPQHAANLSGSTSQQQQQLSQQRRQGQSAVNQQQRMGGRSGTNLAATAASPTGRGGRGRGRQGSRGGMVRQQQGRGTAGGVHPSPRPEMGMGGGMTGGQMGATSTAAGFQPMALPMQGVLDIRWSATSSSNSSSNAAAVASREQRWDLCVCKHTAAAASLRVERKQADGAQSVCCQVNIYNLHTHKTVLC